MGDANGSFKRVVARKSRVSNISNISKKLIDKIKKAADVRIRMERALFSETSFDIDIGMASVAIVSKREYVGAAMAYKLIPYSPIIRV